MVNWMHLRSEGATWQSGRASLWSAQGAARSSWLSGVMRSIALLAKSCALKSMGAVHGQSVTRSQESARAHTPEGNVRFPVSGAGSQQWLAVPTMSTATNAALSRNEKQKSGSAKSRPPFAQLLRALWFVLTVVPSSWHAALTHCGASPATSRTARPSRSVQSGNTLGSVPTVGLQSRGSHRGVAYATASTRVMWAVSAARTTRIGRAVEDSLRTATFGFSPFGRGRNTATNRSTSWSGNRPKVSRSLKGGSSITSMGSRRTTALRTCWAHLATSITSTLARPWCLMRNGFTIWKPVSAMQGFLSTDLRAFLRTTAVLCGDAGRAVFYPTRNTCGLRSGLSWPGA